ncbi:carbon-nitrogen family hydrolase [Paenibacillus sp. MB22_1]|uniref:carbon-nitrogen family hydrolase n=1 Tax=Paenibacillus TaxID=44249 RepID=UPI0001AFD76C|nr:MULTISPECIES: carbon-nitrogen family hydrolase [unclassified Paenibacillus]EES72102.1 hydrolase, carbon-nitrogen family [Paenibacillus sp. oral taxon 786 str. D14]MCT2195519.1 carbon-nitrogen family hydrolase [Paenibacillus sp. p3-SID1389]
MPVNLESNHVQNQAQNQDPSRSNRWRIALIQCDIVLGQPEVNRAKLEAAMDRAARAAEKPDVILLPELWNTGYALTEIGRLADPEGQNSRAWLAAFARRHGIHVIGGSIAENRSGQVYNTMLVFNRSGEEVAAYSKIHLFRLMEEEKYLQPGERSVTFELDGLPAGAEICYDIRFPELTRSLALRGAKLLFVAAEWPLPRLNHWRTLLIARAIENQMYVIACNRTGKGGGDEFFGHSMIIDPWGEIVAEGGEAEEIVTGSIDLTLVDQVRRRIPVFDDRRPLAYD